MRALFACLLLSVGALLSAPMTVQAAGWQDAILGNDPYSYRKPAGTERTTDYGQQSARTETAQYDDGVRPQRRSRRRSASSYSAKSYIRPTPSRYSGGGAGSGLASYYWQPQRVASGGWFNPNALTAAHKTLPFGTKVRVTNQRNGRSVVVTINDRGPFVKGRVIDLSSRAAGVIGMKSAGVAPISMTVLGR